MENLERRIAAFLHNFTEWLRNTMAICWGSGLDYKGHGS